MALLIPASPAAYRLLLIHLWKYNKVTELEHFEPSPTHWTVLGLELNPCISSEKPVISHLSCGMIWTASLHNLKIHWKILHALKHACMECYLDQWQK